MVEVEVRQFLSENFILQGGRPLAGDESLTESGVIDSLGVLELVLFLEERYGIKVSEAETLPENLDTVDNLIRFIETKLHTGAEPTRKGTYEHRPTA